MELTVTLSLEENDLLDIALLKQADDNESALLSTSSDPVSLDRALEKLLGARDRGNIFWTARDGGVLIGYAVGNRTSESFRSEGVYVKPEHRGKNIGTLLLQSQIDHARHLDCTEVWSNVALANYASRRMLEKLGFSFEESGGGYIVRLPLR